MRNHQTCYFVDKKEGYSPLEEYVNYVLFNINYAFLFCWVEEMVKWVEVFIILK